ncbi:MAG TPA: hypothetical protein PLS77_12525 [Anaerolineaceae bacterium]|jgi:hypothetical protein|nr:hypothetical protein [Anaerolineaceae bacterium]HQF46619.1 hypothetical protein [Anaerolineaceae bacterium]HQH36520.1 hypothetical protein [Anaerolineaceae bacterium]HQJ04579.1 hypothetical protein [Anaerolineaceae bacterium]
MEKIEETLVLETNVANLFNLILSYWEEVQADFWTYAESVKTENETIVYGVMKPRLSMCLLEIDGNKTVLRNDKDSGFVEVTERKISFKVFPLNPNQLKLIGRCHDLNNQGYRRLFYDIWNRIKMDFGLPIESPKQQKEETIYTMPNGKPIQRGKPGRPRHDEDVKAEERLANGENEQTVRRDWEAEYSKKKRILADEERTWRFIVKRAREEKKE